MPIVNLWKNVAVSMQSALATAKTITGISKGNPGVVTSTAHGYSNGDYVVLAVQGMRQLDGKVVRVAGITTDTYQTEGIDTTLFDTFSSGTNAKVTYGTTIQTATSMAASGGNFDFIDVTTIHQNQKAQVPGLANPLTYTFDNLWDPSDAGEIAMKAASDQSGQRAFKFVFSTGATVVFNGYVGFTGAPTGNAQDKVVSPAVITAFGSITNYAS